MPPTIVAGVQTRGHYDTQGVKAMQGAQTYTLTRAPSQHVRNNVGSIERWGSAATGGALLTYGLSRRSAVGAVLATAGSALLARGASGRCPIYSGLGITNVEPVTVEIHDAIRLQARVQDVYRFWRQLENLPRFMRYLQRVDDLGNGRSHWVAKAPGGGTVEWDAEILHEIENNVIAWRSLPGGEVSTSGSVYFDPVRRGESAQITVRLHYDPPAGRLGKSVAQLMGRGPSRTVREDLRRLKQLIEAGEIPRAHADAHRAVSETEVGR